MINVLQLVFLALFGLALLASKLYYKAKAVPVGHVLQQFKTCVTKPKQD